MQRRYFRVGFWLVFRRELFSLRRHPFLLCLTTLLPLVLIAILCTTFSAGLAVRLPIAVLDLDTSDLSRQIIRTVDATPDAAVALRVSDLSEGKRAILSGDVYGLLFLPRNLEKDVFAGRQPEVVFFYNNQQMTPGSLSARGVANAVVSVENYIRLELMQKKGIKVVFAQQSLNPIPVRINTLFNPTQNYSYFLLASVIPAILQTVIIIASVYSVGLDFGVSHRFRILRRLGNGLWPAIAGKILPYTLIFMGILGISDVVLFYYFDLPLNGNPALLVISGILFITACQLYGALLAILIKPVDIAVSLATLIVSPAFGFMGIGFPRFGMNTFSYLWGMLIPGTWYLTVRIDQTIRGTPAELSLQPILILLCFNIILFAILVIKLERIKNYNLHKKDLSKNQERI